MATDWPDRPRDAPLILRWETGDDWALIKDALALPDASDTLAATALALYVEGIGYGRWVSYSRRRAHYSKPRRYRSRLYTFDRVVPAVDTLDDEGLIEHIWAQPGDLGRQSTIRATAELRDWMEGALGSAVNIRMPPETVILRDANKLPLDYTDNRVTHRMRRQLAEQNEAIMGTGLTGGDILHLRAPLRRIFNASFLHGGRFYAEGGGWQTLTKAERLRMEIDGEPVVEIDYAQFHPTLAYARIGLAAPTDAYDVPGFERRLVKVAFAIMLNGNSRNGARHTLAHKPVMVRRILGVDIPESIPRDAMWLEAEKLHRGYAQRASREAEHLIEVLLAKHRPIASMFFCGAGLWLQRLDSDIAEAVMREMRRRGIVVLPIHDSFLVPASKAGLLEQVMTDETAKVGATVSRKRSAIVP